MARTTDDKTASGQPEARIHSRWARPLCGFAGLEPQRAEARLYAEARIANEWT
ncbi:MAG TPA: hypothetical protein VIY29_02080 [Ktedonobacteraceae bacterium]